MAIPKRKTWPSESPGLHWVETDDGSRTLWDESLDETYHSGCGAFSETWTVYLRNSGVSARLDAGLPTQVLEYGFGSATSFLMTAAYAEACQTHLRFTALENRLLPTSLLAALEFDGATLSEQLGGDDEFPPSHRASWMAQFQKQLERLPMALTRALEHWECGDQNKWTQEPTGNAPFKRIELTIGECVSLQLLLGDATEYSSESLVDSVVNEARADTLWPQPGFHAVYFDPFSPESNPGLWQPSVFKNAYRALLPGGRLTSYCVKGAVRRGLAEVGFRVRKAAGPLNGKREVLVAERPNDSFDSNGGDRDLSA